MDTTFRTRAMSERSPARAWFFELREQDVSFERHELPDVGRGSRWSRRTPQRVGELDALSRARGRSAACGVERGGSPQPAARS
jgi:hypothetical protein